MQQDSNVKKAYDEELEYFFGCKWINYSTYNYSTAFF
jgi:hypothetical protein